MKKVLFVEPNRLLARTYQQALVASGHQVRIAGDAQQAIEQADDFAPDVVVLELLLGAHDGVEFLHEFRSYPDWQQIPVIINSSLLPGRMASLEAVLDRDYGVTKCLYKPHTKLEQLIRMIKEA